MIQVKVGSVLLSERPDFSFTILNYILGSMCACVCVRQRITVHGQSSNKYFLQVYMANCSQIH